MNGQIVLGQRLQTIIDLANEAETIADIGCDHGKVAIALALKGSHVIASDISEPSLNKARRLAQEYNVAGNVEFFCTDGLKVVPQGIDSIIISGMGERLIIDIIQNDIDIAKSAANLILLPMDSTYLLREYLIKTGFIINNEKLSLDENRLYCTLRVNYDKPYALTEIERIIGPKIIENNDKLLNLYIDNELKKCNIKLNGLKNAKKMNFQLINDVKDKIQILNELIEKKGLEK